VKAIDIVNQFKNKKILVVGDIMLDKYIWGEVNRISPEAPVQIVNVTRESHNPGGAANVAANITEYGAEAHLIGIVGEDSTKENLMHELDKRNINTTGIVADQEKRTILKVRVFGRNQQLLRFDYEKKGYASHDTEDKILEALKSKIEDMDAVVVSDYAKGVITKRIMLELIAQCHKEGKSIIIDPKPEHKEYYSNATLITPNHNEAHQMTHFTEKQNVTEDVEDMGRWLVNDLKSSILITRGEKGMSLFEKNGNIKHIPTFAKEVFDIIGAGDTVVATVALALASGASIEQAAVIANHAAGVTVGKIGTSTVSLEELKRRVQHA